MSVRFEFRVTSVVDHALTARRHVDEHLPRPEPWMKVPYYIKKALTYKKLLHWYSDLLATLESVLGLRWG